MPCWEIRNFASLEGSNSLLWVAFSHDLPSYAQHLLHINHHLPCVPCTFHLQYILLLMRSMSYTLIATCSVYLVPSVYTPSYAQHVLHINRHLPCVPCTFGIYILVWAPCSRNDGLLRSCRATPNLEDNGHLESRYCMLDGTFCMMDCVQYCMLDGMLDGTCATL